METPDGVNYSVEQSVGKLTPANTALKAAGGYRKEVRTQPIGETACKMTVEKSEFGVLRVTTGHKNTGVLSPPSRGSSNSKRPESIFERLLGFHDADLLSPSNMSPGIKRESLSVFQVRGGAWFSIVTLVNFNASHNRSKQNCFER